MDSNRDRDHISSISANVLQTNIGDLIHSHVILHSPDVLAKVETFLNESIPNNYGFIQGYTRWYRRDSCKKALGLDGISTHILNNSASQLAAPVTAIFQLCLDTGKWLSFWKVARVAATHKKTRKTKPKSTDLSPSYLFLVRL